MVELKLMSAVSGPILVDFGPKLADLGHELAEPGRELAIWVEVGPLLVDFGDLQHMPKCLWRSPMTRGHSCDVPAPHNKPLAATSALHLHGSQGALRPNHADQADWQLGAKHPRSHAIAGGSPPSPQVSCGRWRMADCTFCVAVARRASSASPNGRRCGFGPRGRWAVLTSARSGAGPSSTSAHVWRSRGSPP